ncbi:hypothetical protein ACFXA0_20390 [Streptomyces cyaneofuscatus]|uniref:hypothetical protein n=1 Tax=Streptomyces TaxID=1883 RepID=UPI001F45A794|nr:hypothetical protein [Streptomyces sp. SID2119]
MTDVTDRIGNVTRQRYEQLVTQAKELIAQIAPSEFSLGDMALEIEPMRAVGGSMPNGTDDLFTVTESLQMFADDIGVERRTVEDWRYTANRWPEKRRKEGVSFTASSPRSWTRTSGERRLRMRRSTRARGRGSGRRTARSGSSASGSTGR